MKVVLQRVSEASVDVVNELGTLDPTFEPQQIGPGFMILVGVTDEDGEQIAAVIGRAPAMADAAAPRASGTLESHYAPHTPVAMQHSDDVRATLNRLLNDGRRVALIHYSDLPPASASVRLAASPENYAHALYASLRTMDQVGAELILVEAPPTGPAWLGVNDRLRRAAFGSSGILQQFLSA